MKRFLRPRVLGVLTLLCSVLVCGWWAKAAFEDAGSHAERRAAALKLYNDGNYAEAHDDYRKLALDPDNQPREVGTDLAMGLECLRALGRVPESDALIEETVAVHAGNWRLLVAAAQSYQVLQHYGYKVAGKFSRGDNQNTGEFVNCEARDRVRALQLLVQAMPLANQDENHGETGDFYFTLASAMLNNRGYYEAWRLQLLTNLEELPDYEAGWYYGRGEQGAAVDADGAPIYYTTPESWEAAVNDGQRWRWCLAQAVEFNAANKNRTRWELAQFCQSQFGVQTMAQYGFGWGMPRDDTDDDTSGTYALHTLTDGETIARLATGIRRFELPEEFNYLLIYQTILKDRETGYAELAIDALANEMLNRRLYPRAADYWRQAIAEFGPGQNNYRQQQLDQIVGNWARFEGGVAQPAGQGAVLALRFRNATHVSFEAREILVDKLLQDVKAHLESNPQQLDWQQLNIQDVGWRLVEMNQEQYLGENVASWELDLEPRENHFDKRIDVTTPLQESGAYLVTARLADGNLSRVIVWLADTAIVKKTLDGQTLYYVADAVTGQPVAKANVEFFGYHQVQVGNTNRYNVVIKKFAEFSDADGLVYVPTKPDDNQYGTSWLITARTKKGRHAYLGFSGVWHQQRYDEAYNQVKVFSITDRPVYRPDQPVKFKFWVRRAQYDQPETSDFANQNFVVELHDPQGEKVWEQNFQSDAYGGFDGEYALPLDAKLGVYNLYVRDYGGGSFRVEEYKKPEYEVTVEAPTAPVQLGEKIQATVHADYYFGAPVANGRVKYKVLRTSYRQQWYPIGPWDWFYGPGYWWFAYDYQWYPGWQKWGCERPLDWWWGQSYDPPEIVADAEAALNPDGTFTIDIDTAVALELHPNQDHQYQIVAEVTDESRRTIVGQGTVMVARAPFKVFVWANRGYFRVGDRVDVQIDAHTLDEQPVAGAGQLQLLQVTYDEQRQPVETLVEEWDLNTDERGQATQQFVAPQAGQYRVKYVLTDAAGRAIEGGYVFTVTGDDFTGGDLRYNALELIPDKQEYAPGERVQLMINTDRVDSTVLLFVRPTNGVYLPPQVVRLTGKSTIVELDVTLKDMPNFFIEALTLADARLHSQTKEIVVPPVERVLNVSVEPSATEYLPGAPAEVKLTLTELDGRPFVGTTALTIYDSALEYISGGSNVPEIKEFFWKWRRNHYPQTECSLDKYSYNVVKSGETPMGDLGMFGATVADELKELDKAGTEHLGDDRANSLRDGMARRGAMAAPGAPMAASESAALSADFAGGIGGGGFGGGELQQQAQGEGGAPPPLVQPTVRSNFADAAYWAGALETDGDGVATIKLNMPENLTEWTIKCWGLGHGTRVGQGTATVVTKKNLIVRLQAPRFFVERDEVVLSANVHNYLSEEKAVEVRLELEGGVLEPTDELVRQVVIPAGGEQRVDWRVRVTGEGQALVRMAGLSDVESDAMELSFPAYVHGMLKMDSYAGAIRPTGERGGFEFTIPAERRPAQSRLEVRYSPSLAGALVDALPYLTSYPYGCTEQTLNRFLPTVITQRILLDMQLDLAAIRDKRTNLNAQEIGDDQQRATGWKRYDENPVFDEETVRRMVKDGVQALTNMQLSDGGWGWFSGYGEQSWPHTTAYVVHGLQIAAQNDVALYPGMLERGVQWLQNYQAEQIRLLQNGATETLPYKKYADELDAFVYMVLIDADVASVEMRDFLYRDRTKLSVYAKAMFGLALHAQQDAERLTMILRNIAQFVVQDEENQTAYLRLPEDRAWWSWHGDEIESLAYYLKLLAKTDPQSEVAAGLVKYLLNNRKHATYWNSTRDTSLCIEAIADYFRASGENEPEMTVEVYLDGKLQKAVEITRENLFTFDNKFVLEGEAVATGRHTLELRRQGKGPVYFNGYVTNFTLEEFIERAGLEVRVDRKFYRLVPVEATTAVSGSRGQAVEQRVEKYDRVEIPNLGEVTSGDLVEVELLIQSKNDYEYLLFEDMKAAGFEPVDLRSGYNGNSLGAYMEFRDNRVCLFVRALGRGQHSVSYRLRAEIPGQFSALPTRAMAMYAPELRGNSDELQVIIHDRPLVAREE